MTSFLKVSNLALAFLLELVALVAVGMWGVHVGSTRVASTILAVVAVATWAAVWGFCFSPRAGAGLGPVGKQAGQFAMFVVAVVATGASGHWGPAAVFGALVAVNRVLIAVWGQEGAQRELGRGRR